MKYTVFSSQSVFGMANLPAKRTGLSADIWSDHKGIERSVSHRGTPRIKISVGSYMVSVTIESTPVIKAESKHSTKSQKSAVKEAMKYRSIRIDSKMSPEQRKFYVRMKQIYSLEKEVSKEKRQAQISSILFKGMNIKRD